MPPPLASVEGEFCVSIKLISDNHFRELAKKLQPLVVSALVAWKTCLESFFDVWPNSTLAESLRKKRLIARMNARMEGGFGKEREETKNGTFDSESRHDTQSKKDTPMQGETRDCYNIFRNPTRRSRPTRHPTTRRSGRQRQPRFFFSP